MKQLLLTLSLSLFAACAWAFPSTPVLDTFTGCVDTTTPPNSNWTNAVLRGATSSTVDCEDLAMTSTGGATSGDAYWNVSTFAANSEAYATLISPFGAGHGLYVCLRLANIGANTTDGYCTLVDFNAATVYLVRLDNGVDATLNTTAQTAAAGDKVGISAAGDRICSWYKVGAGAWTQIACVTDSTYQAGGRLGVSIYGAAAEGNTDDFGGGNSRAGGSVVFFN